MNDIEDYIKNSSQPIIYACSSQYNVLMAFLFILLYGNEDTSCVIMFSPSKDVVETFERISSGMNKYGIMNAVIDKKTVFHRALGISDIRNHKIGKKIFRKMNLKGGDYLLVNFSWDFRKITYPASMYFDRCASSIFVEEGATQYVTPSRNAFILLLKKLYGNQIDFWEDRKIKDVFVQYPDRFLKLPVVTKRFSIDEIIYNLTSVQKTKVIEVFGAGISVDYLEKILEKVDGIIFTQPLSEDGYITEKKKREIYEELVGYYKQYGNVVVKIHPRDNTRYEFKDANILPKEFPSELLNILGIKFEFAIALCSSAVENVNAKKSINLNEKYLSELEYDLQDLQE